MSVLKRLLFEASKCPCASIALRDLWLPSSVLVLAEDLV